MRAGRTEGRGNGASSAARPYAAAGMVTYAGWFKSSAHLPYGPMWQTVGLDPAALLAQREQLVQARMARRRADLEAMPATLPGPVKTRALAELRALNLVEFQAEVRRGMKVKIQC